MTERPKPGPGPLNWIVGSNLTWSEQLLMFEMSFGSVLSMAYLGMRFRGTDLEWLSALGFLFGGAALAFPTALIMRWRNVRKAKRQTAQAAFRSEQLEQYSWREERDK